MTRRALIVEDDPEKCARMAMALRSSRLTDARIDYAKNKTEARRLLREVEYDFMLLDLAIPQRQGDQPRAANGSGLLDEISKRPGYLRPKHIVAITAVEEGWKLRDEIFGKHGVTTINYDPASAAWVEQLHARAMQAVGAEMAEKPDDGYGSHLGIVCALDAPELAAVRRIWNFRQLVLPHDQTSIYWEASPQLNGETRKVIAVAAAQVGMPSAAVVATKLIYEFRPRYLAMTGIAAGLPESIRLGDVLVVDRCWDWGAGKWFGDEVTTSEFQPAPYQFALDPEIRNCFLRLSADQAKLHEIKAAWPEDLYPHEIQIRVGPVASGASVVASSVTAQRVLDQNRATIGIEMEAYSIFCAAEYAPRPRPKVIVLKSVVDFANSRKSDRSHGYSAYTSASVLRLFMEHFA